MQINNRFRVGLGHSGCGSPRTGSKWVTTPNGHLLDDGYGDWRGNEFGDVIAQAGRSNGTGTVHTKARGGCDGEWKLGGCDGEWQDEDFYYALMQDDEGNWIDE